MDHNSIYTKTKRYVHRKIGDECLLIPISNSTANLNCLYSINEVAGRIYELVDGKATIKEIKEVILDEFIVEEAILEEDLKNLLNSFIDMAAVELCR